MQLTSPHCPDLRFQSTRKPSPSILIARAWRRVHAFNQMHPSSPPGRLQSKRLRLNASYEGSSSTGSGADSNRDQQAQHLRNGAQSNGHGVAAAPGPDSQGAPGASLGAEIQENDKPEAAQQPSLQPVGGVESNGGMLRRMVADALQGLKDENVPKVPWGVGKISQVMLLWLIAYVIVGQVVVPIAVSLLGLDRDTLSIRSHAILHLGLDVSQLAITLLILWRCLGAFKPRQLGLFPIKWRGYWPLIVLGFCAVFPAVAWMAQECMTWFPLEGDQWASQMEHNLSLGDWITNVSYFCLVSICAPIWEEALFRGFLLASLARYMPVRAAVVASSLLFAMCHFRLQTFLPLLVLGIIFSLIFLITRNLLPPIILHSLWNIYVLINLFLKPA